MTSIHQWWLRAPNQGAKHLLPLLALLERGAGNGAAIRFEERPDEYAFWDRYFNVRGNAAKPYVNPLTLRRGEENYPHSNAATIRKNTFRLKWEAATLTEGPNREAMWTLAANYADIFRDKGLTKGGVTARIPVVDLAAFLLRRETFPDDATHATLVAKFRERFPQSDGDFAKLFQINPEGSAQLFVADSVTDDQYDDAMTAALIEDKEAPAPLPAGEIVVPPPLENTEDAVLLQIRELLALNSSGIILRGIPGTSKTWYAQRIAASLVGDPKRDVFRVQFHPSYGYEDFVEGYRPDDTARSGFKVEPKIFREVCDRARAVQHGYVVLIVDEINRGDPARIFGDLLTYLEHGYRGETFHLAYSGQQEYVPANVIVIGTMNPYDRSIAQLDSAFLRRFDHIEVAPSVEMVGTFLEQSGNFSAVQIQRVQQWFEALQRIVPNGVGHTYFKDATRPEHLELIWRYRIWPACEAALEFDATKKANARASFDAMYADVIGHGGNADEAPAQAPPAPPPSAAGA
jgi:5-methylcytosine-specific restriction protein B